MICLFVLICWSIKKRRSPFIEILHSVQYKTVPFVVKNFNLETKLHSREGFKFFGILISTIRNTSTTEAWNINVNDIVKFNIFSFYLSIQLVGTITLVSFSSFCKNNCYYRYRYGIFDIMYYGRLPRCTKSKINLKI